MLGDLFGMALVAFAVLCFLAVSVMFLQKATYRVTDHLRSKGSRQMVHFIFGIYNVFARFFVEIEVAFALCSTAFFCSWYFDQPALALIMPLTFMAVYWCFNTRMVIDKQAALQYMCYGLKRLK